MRDHEEEQATKRKLALAFGILYGIALSYKQVDIILELSRLEDSLSKAVDSDPLF